MSALSFGRTSAMTRSMPTSVAICSATVLLSPVSNTGVKPSALNWPIASRLVGLTVSATTRTPRALPSQPTATAVLPSRSAFAFASARSRPSSWDQSASSDPRPTTTKCPSTTPWTPLPSTLAKSSGVGSSPTSSVAPLAIAWAIGCSEAFSKAPARRSSSARSAPSPATTSVRVIFPVVTVPVLSSTIVSTLRVDSRISGPLMRTPSCAPRPVPTSSAVGVARPRAHGQAMMSTATATVNAAVAPNPAPSQNPSVPTAIAMTIGTKIPETLSARRWTSALPDWASSTSLAICASCVSAPTRVARTTRRPPALTVAPVTSSPSATSTGTDSPVSIEASIAEVPEVMTPSVAIFSPGRTTNSSPTASSATGTRVSTPSLMTATSLAPIWSSARSAAPARRFERFSK